MKIQVIKPHIFQKVQRVPAPKLKPLPYDTVSFSGLELPKPKVMTSTQKEQRFKECIQTTAERAYDSENFLKWAEKIEYKKLVEIAPSVADFDNMQFEDFLLYHYKTGTKEFTEDTLSCKNLEELLAQDLMEYNELSGILTTYPATKKAEEGLSWWSSGWGVGSSSPVQGTWVPRIGELDPTCHD